MTTAANSSGESVVKFFSGHTDVQSDACGSFVRTDDDDSLLSGVCHDWGIKVVCIKTGSGGMEIEIKKKYYMITLFCEVLVSLVFARGRLQIGM